MDRPPRPTATMPDWTSSLMPNGSSTRISASSLSRLPVASTVTASRATSTTLARKSWTVSSTFDRLSVSARTLISSSSRWTACPCSSSTILSTLISLLSCLVTCSSGCSSQLTTIVIREISSCSVGPTASESMLNPRRENSPATRTSSPGLFSTKTDNVCLLMFVLPPSRALRLLREAGPRRRGTAAALRVLAVRGPAPAAFSLFSVVAWSFGHVPVGGHVAGHLDVVVARAGGHHRPDHRVPLHDEIDHDRLIVDLHGLLDHLVHLAWRLAAQADAAVGLGQLDEVGHARPGRRRRIRLRAQVGLGVPPVVEQGLPLPDHTEVAVVDDGHLDRDALQRAGGQLLVGHLEAAVAIDRPHARLGTAHLGAHGRGHRESHGAQATGVDPGSRLLVGDELGGPHLMLADARHIDRLRTGDLPDPLDHVLRRERAVGRLLVAERVGAAPGVKLRPPGGEVAGVPGLAL